MNPEDLILPGLVTVGAGLAMKLKQRLSDFPHPAVKKAAKPGIDFAGEFWPWGEVCRHFLFFGGTGAGKTFCSDMLIGELISAGCPMLVTTVKPDDFERIEGIAKAKGHASRLKQITPGGPYRMNMFESLLDPHQSEITAAELAVRISQVGNRPTTGGSGDNKFFEDQAKRGIAAAVTVCRKVLKRIRVPEIHQLLLTTPQSLSEVFTSDEWTCKEEKNAKGEKVERGFCARVLLHGDRMGLEESDSDYANAVTWLLRELCGAGDRMRGSILAECFNALGCFLSKPWDTFFSSDTTLTPKMIDEHALIGVLDMPEMVGLRPARMAQAAWTLEAQRWIGRRPYRKGSASFEIIRDEVGRLLNGEADAAFAQVARGQGGGLVDLVQDIDTLLNGLGGGEAKYEANSFVNNHMCKLFFGSNSVDTNKLTSALIGQKLKTRLSGGGNHRRPQPTGDFLDDCLGVGGDVHWQQAWEPVVRPEELAKLPVGVCMMVARGQHRWVDFRQ